MKGPDSNYVQSHRDPVNLVIHAFAVPFFFTASIVALLSLVSAHYTQAAMAFVVISLSIGLQGFGHKREAVPPRAFDGPGDFITRIFREQFYTFWVFVLSGQWKRNIQQHADQS